MQTLREGILLTTAASMLWGTVFISIGIGLRYVDPYSLLFLRFFAAAVPILVLAGFYERKLHILRALRSPAIWALSFVYYAGFAFQYVGQQLTNASDATLVSNMGPIMAPVIAYFLLREKPTVAKVAALGLGVLGLVFIALPKLSPGSSNALGDLFLAITSVSYAIFIVANKRYGSGGLAASLAMILALTLFSFPLAVYEGLNPFALNLTPLSLAAILWMGIPCTVIAITLYLKGLSKISVTLSSMLLLLQVLAGLLLANLLLGERLSYFEDAGALCIFAAVVLSSLSLGRPFRKQKRVEPELQIMHKTQDSLPP